MSTNDRKAGWRPDPYARAKERFYDGEAWTAEIRSDGHESIDSLGATATIPFTNPTGIKGTLEPKLEVKRSGIGGVFDSVTGALRRLFHRR